MKKSEQFKIVAEAAKELAKLLKREPYATTEDLARIAEKMVEKFNVNEDVAFEIVNDLYNF